MEKDVKEIIALLRKINDNILIVTVIFSIVAGLLFAININLALH